MKKKLFYLVMFNIVLALGIMVIGCDDGGSGVTEVKGTVTMEPFKTNPVPSVTATKTNNGEYIIITFDAVDDVGGYSFIVQQENTKGLVTINSFAAYYSTPQVIKKYDIEDGNDTLNDNWDKYYARITIAGTNAIPGKKYRFGVWTFDKIGLFGTSDTTWSNYIQF